MTVAATDAMRALVFAAPGVVELQDVAAPAAEDGSVILRVRAAGICGSELHGFRSVGFRVPPLVMGHEIAGETADGRRVAVNPLSTCGVCDSCERGTPQLCRNRVLLGAHRPGGFAERVAVPAEALHDLPAGLSWEAAALVEPLANAVHAWRQADAAAASRVAILGSGTIGLVCLLWARHIGRDGVTVVDLSQRRLATAERLGAATCATQLTGEYDLIIDAVGATATRRASLEHLRPGGTTVWIGLAQPEPAFDGNDLVRSEKHVVGSFAYTPAEFAEAVASAPQLDLGWATPVPLEDSQRVFMELAGGSDEILKAVIRP